MTLGITSLMIMMYVGSAFDKELKAQYKSKNDALTIAFNLKDKNSPMEIQNFINSKGDKITKLKYYYRLYGDKNIFINGREVNIEIYCDSNINETEINEKYYEMYGLSPITLAYEDKNKAPEEIHVSNINKDIKGSIPVVMIPENIKDSIKLLNVREITAQIKCRDEKAAEDIIASLNNSGYIVRGGAVNYSKISFRVNTLKFSLLILGLVALIISLSTISNTISVAIEERGKDIEIMKILGAKDKSLIALFITEVLIVGIVSAFIGTTLSFTASYALNTEYKALGISELFNIYEVSLVSVKNILMGVSFSLFIIFITVFLILKSLISKSYLEVLKDE